MNEAVKRFLNEYGFYTDLDLKSLVDLMISDMKKGLTGQKACQDMIRTYINPSSIKISKKSVLVIDAGGTNFRSSMVNFSDDGSFSTSDFEKTAMPATDKELSKEEFFGQIAKNIERFKDKCSEICFCFSYAMTITEDKDGILESFSKEVKAPEVVGSHIGKELKEALKKSGWTKIPEVILLNDTAAALLAGTGKKNYSAYIGFILGTGLNAAYTQNDNKEYNINKQIIVCESAKFDGFKNSDFDIILDEKSVNPGTSPFEKLCSGAYLGLLALETLKFATKEKLFSPEFCKGISLRKALSLMEVSSFLENSFPEKDDYSYMFRAEGASPEDERNLFQIFDALVNRMAQLSAVVIASCLIQCEEGKSKESPVCVSCNGSSFYKTYEVIPRTKKYLDEILEGKNIYYELSQEEADITLGSAMAAFTNC